MTNTSIMSTVFPMQSDKISGHTPGGYPIGDRAISSSDLADIDREIYSDGIISTAAGSGAYYQVTADGGMNLVVQPGKCFIRGRRASTPTNTIITVDDADNLMNRVDRVVLRLDLSTEVRDVVVAVKRGDTSLTRTSSIWELGLADVRVDSGTRSISQSMITDLRFDSNICGRAFNELLKVDTTGIFDQMQAITSEQEDKWKTQTKEQESRWRMQTDSQQDSWQVMRDSQKNDYDNWKAQIDAWANLTAGELAKVITMDLNNLSAYPGTAYSCIFNTDGSIFEKLSYKSGRLIFGTCKQVLNWE